MSKNKGDRLVQYSGYITRDAKAKLRKIVKMQMPMLDKQWMSPWLKVMAGDAIDKYYPLVEAAEAKKKETAEAT
jgi:hypothetical protein